MNARKLRHAFMQMSPVYCSDKSCPVNNGYVLSVMHTLNGSGKVRCDAELRNLDHPREVVKTNCRHVHFKGDPKEVKDMHIPHEGKPVSEHAEAIRQAFMKGEPVVISIPGIKPTEYRNITALIYTRNRKGSIICSCICIDSNRADSTTQARIRYVYTKSEFQSIEKGR